MLEREHKPSAAGLRGAVVLQLQVSQGELTPTLTLTLTLPVTLTLALTLIPPLPLTPTLAPTLPLPLTRCHTASRVSSSYSYRQRP